MSRESVAFNIKDPQPSVFGERSRLARQEPTTSEVLGAFIEEAFQGEGTLVQDIAASNIRKQERRGEPITQKTWKESNNFREGLSWYEGMTKKSAETLAKIEDERNERQNIFDRASGIQKGFGIGTQLITGIFEPKNFHSGQIAAIATAGVGSAAPTIGRLVSTKTVRGAATRGAVEGTIAAGVTEISSRESSAIVQGDYTMADTLMNFGLSMVLGAGLGAGVKGLEKRARGKRLEEIKAFRADRAIATKEFDTALGQMTQGQRVDVEAVAEVENLTKVNKAVKELPVIEEKLNTKIAESKLVPVTERPEFNYQIREVQRNNRTIKEVVNLDPNIVQFAPNDPSVDTALSRSKPIISSIKKGGAEQIKPILLKRKEGGELEIVDGNARLTAFRDSGVNIPRAILYKDEFTGEGKTGRVTQSEELQALQTRKGQLEQDAGRTLNEAPIDNFKKSLETNANSSAYDETIPQDVTKSLELAQQSDDKIFQDDLQFAQEQAQEMLEQGQLTDADIKNLEKLENIDTEMEIYDNIYSNLKNCLIR